MMYTVCPYSSRLGRFFFFKIFTFHQILFLKQKIFSTSLNCATCGELDSLSFKNNEVYTLLSKRLERFSVQRRFGHIEDLQNTYQQPTYSNSVQTN